MIALGNKDSKNSKEESKRLNDNILLAIFSLPYLYDFIVGIFCFYFMTKIAENNSAKRNEDYENLNEEIVELQNDQEIRNEIVRRQEQSE